jgi:3-methylfumaryl-CoA hydratase
MSEAFADWIGRRETREDVLDRRRADALAAALGETPTSDETAPPLRHWLHFWDPKTPADTGPDGHASTGGFLPPLPGTRRMWAGGEVEFRSPLLFDQPVTRVSEIGAVTEKAGASGPLTFVTVRHELSQDGALCVVERQDLVFREPAPASAPRQTPPPMEATWRREITPDPVLLFRFSALTFNSHRIHYDRDYARAVEGYAGLVVHGPLQAMLMLDLARHHLPAPVRRFSYRGVAPALDLAALEVCGAPDEGGAALWTCQGGAVCMSGRAET